MKKLFFIILFLPLLTFGQNYFNYGIIVKMTRYPSANVPPSIDLQVTDNNGNTFINTSILTIDNIVSDTTSTIKFIPVDINYYHPFPYTIRVEYCKPDHYETYPDPNLNETTNLICDFESETLSIPSAQYFSFTSLIFSSNLCSDCAPGSVLENSPGGDFEIYLIHLDNIQVNTCNNSHQILKSGWLWQKMEANETNFSYILDANNDPLVARSLDVELNDTNYQPGTLYFRTGVHDDYDNIDYWSEPISFDIYPAPPPLYDDPNTPELDGFILHPPLCNNGEIPIELIFEENLNTNESLLLEFYSGNSTQSFDSHEFTGPLTVVNNGYKLSYTLQNFGYDNASQQQTLKIVYKKIINGQNGSNSDCTGEISKDFTNPAKVQASIQWKKNASCYGVSDGEIFVSNVNGGTSNYIVEYSKLNNQGLPGSITTQQMSAQDIIINGLSAGTYKVQVKDSNGCYATWGADDYQNIIINQPDTLQVSINNTYATSCYGGGDGGIDFTVTGGWGNNSLSYQLLDSNNNIVQDSNNNFVEGTVGSNLTELRNLYSGTYKLRVATTDPIDSYNTCSVIIDNITIDQPDKINIHITQQNVSCNGGQNGSIILTATGGVGGYQYSLDNQVTWEDFSVPGDSNNPSGNHTLTNLTAGTYQIYVRDGNEICLNSLEVTITEPSNPLTVNITQQNISCNGGQNGSITLTATGGVGGYQYSLDNQATWEDFSVPGDSNNPNGNHTLANLTAGTYQIYVRDGNECLANSGSPFEITITETNPVTVSITQQNVSCNGGNDGSISLIATGGVGGYQYSLDNQSTWIDFSTPGDSNNPNGNHTLTNLTAGTYQIYVRDGNECLANSGIPFEITITEPSNPLTVNITQQNVSCNGEQNGSITLTATGGVGGYQYSLDNQATWEDFDVQGNANDANGTTQINNLDSGTYEIFVKDSNNCLANNGNSYHITISEPLPLSISYTSQNVSCYGGSNANIQLNVTGGSLPYTYQWNNGSIQQNLSNLSAGIYSVIVTDANGCTVQQQITITEPQQALEVTYTSQSPSSSGGSDGWIKAVVTGGTPNPDGSYTFIWLDNNANDLSQNISTQVVNGNFEILLNNIPAGTYHLTVRDANYSSASGANCSIEDDIYVLTEPDLLVVSLQIQHQIFCNGGNDGSIIANATGGVALDSNSNNGLLYYYSWYQEINAQWVLIQNENTNILNGLVYGNYKVIVEDSSGTTAEATISLEEPQEITINITTENVSCNGADDGIINIIAQNGVGGFEYKLDNNAWQAFNIQGSIDNPNGQHQITALTPGNHSLLIRDANACMANNGNPYIISITEPDALQISYTQTNVSCVNGNDGRIQIEVLGGTPPYYYHWNSGETTQNIDNLLAGSYTVDITDSNNCSVSETIVIEQPSQNLQITFVNEVQPTFNGATDGSIKVLVTGGMPLNNGTYNFQWTNSSGTDMNAQVTGQTISNGFELILNNIPADTYVLNVYDSNYTTSTGILGCNYQIFTHTLNQPSSLGVYIQSITDITCFGSATGSLEAIAGGGVPLDPNTNNGLSYYYTWYIMDNTGQWTMINNQDSNILTNVVAGNYKVIITDANGITAENTFILSQPDQISILGTVENVLCNTGNDGSIQLQITGGTPPYTYHWNNGATTQNLNNLVAGNYTVTVTDANNCQSDANFEITQPDALDINISQLSNPTCYDADDGSINLSVTGGNPPYTYSVNGNSTISNITNLSAGVYDIIVTDSNNCSVSTQITLENPDPITIDLGPDRTLCIGQVLELDASINDPNATYLWQSDNGFTSNSQLVTLTDAGTYTVTATSGQGCTGTDEIVITTSNDQIDADFLVTSQAFANEDIILINTSNPMPTNVEWIVPNNVQILQQSIETITLNFPVAGVYNITIRSLVGDCIAESVKSIVVNEARDLPQVPDSENPFIKEFNVFPNPSNGLFTVDVILAQTADISLRIFRLTSELPVDDRVLSGEFEYNVNYDLTLTTGTYFILLETNGKRQIRKLLIN